MRCLWLTLADPEPRHNGQYVYSGGLIDCGGRGRRRRRGAGPGPHRLAARQRRQRSEHVVWWLPGDVTRSSRWGSLASTPAAHRLSLPHHRHAAACCDKLLERDGWDGIVFDGISAGWALPTGARPLCRPQRPAAPDLRLAQSRGEPAQPDRREPAAVPASARPCVSMRSRYRAWSANSSTPSISSRRSRTRTCKLYQRRRCDKPMGVLTPGYCGRRLDERRSRARCRAAP